MHWLDTVLLVALGLGAALGFASGLFLQVARVVSLGLALLATVTLHDAAVQALRDWMLRDADPALVQGAAYLTVFLAVYVSLFFVTRVLRSWLRATDLALADRLLGAGLGAGKFAVVLGAVCLLLRHTSHPAPQEWLEHSTMAPAFARGMERAVALVPDDCKKPVFDSFRQLQETISKAPGKEHDN